LKGRGVFEMHNSTKTGKVSQKSAQKAHHDSAFTIRTLTMPRRLRAFGGTLMAYIVIFRKGWDTSDALYCLKIE
jgi:hypothetical protein